jgi:hypothetical protein
MVRSMVNRVMWVGRATLFMVGLLAIVALLFGVAYVALGAGGDRTSQNAQMSVEPLAARQLEVPRGYAQINVTPSTVTFDLVRSKGINDVKRSTTDPSVYCFDLKFAPRAAVASAHINNNATVGTVLGSGVPSGCTAPYRDAAARTYAANTSAPVSEVNFGIVFI